jgi:hypothetical protein
MRAEWLKMSICAPNKLFGGWTENVSETPHYAYTWPLAVIPHITPSKID